MASMPPVDDELAGIAQEEPTGYRAIVRYDDIKRISRDPRTFSSAQGVLAGDAPLGEKVVLFYLSGNRDEAAIDDPGRFDVTRDPNYHLGFGGGGPHYCLGASLARTQLRSIFGELLTRLPDIEVGEPDTLASTFIRGVKRMECSFTARGA